MTESANGAVRLDGHLEPVPDEIDAVNLPVTGVLPPELTGRYLRNGPNPLPGETSSHGFLGHGMIHGVRLRDGRAEWYRNRWVRTGRLAGDPFVRPDGTRDLAAVAANTHVIEHSGRLLALVESGFPHALTPDLDTLGPCDFGGRLTTAMTAHPKEDPDTGELFFFGYGIRPPYLTYHRLSADGELVHSAEVDVPGPTMVHDFAITRNHLVWLDLPVVFDGELLGRGMPFRWDDGYGARLGVMPRNGGAVRWFEIEPCYVFHVGNAWEDEAGRIVVDGVRYSPAAWDRIWSAIGGVTSGAGAPVAAAAAQGGTCLYRWVLDPATGRAREEQLDDRWVEFPTLNDDLVGRGNRYLYAVVDDSAAGRTGAVVKYDLRGGATQTHELGGDRVSGEAVFVPAADGRAEDEGWLLSIVSDRAGTGSDLLVLDATDLSAPPVASVHLPRRVPSGFHGSWIPDAH
ncbi:carotenoid oxygenase family protein [Streptoalloteichus hindustanus]|uniref:Dioxygenase n=1 Tax=Streptoalloteichus hindustanus TaxID=2017 RepID=A0A1M5LBZ2_STRHI|nr:carotenoid oxygenase family protein [Streptoalloteichus hindustanus]SHG62612.1 carotenoid cleavage dioxygenase [Streptoalloteichus hindustanus]